MNTINNNTNLVESSIVNGGSEDADLRFAFDFFSDKIIQLEIMKDLIDVFPNVESCSTSVDPNSRNKRRREDIQKDNGDEAANSPDVADYHMDLFTVLKVRTLHVSSAVLAGKSMFFYKLFSNGMRESQQTHVTLRIEASEEAPIMELLNFMYRSSLSATSPPNLLDILMAADKFEVASCMRYCIRVLLSIPMTVESALLYLELPFNVRKANVVRPLIIAAKQYLATRYKNITKHQEELMGLPIAGVVALLSSDELQVASEDVVFDFVLKWARTQYPSLEERREIFRSKLIHFIRFPYMTCDKLRTVLTCNDVDHRVTSKLVFDALYFKNEVPHVQKILAAKSASTGRRFVERSYKYRPVKVVEFELPHQHCVVYLNLKREECANLFPSSRICSQDFHLGGQRFFLSAHCNMNQRSFYHCFDLFLCMHEKDSSNITIGYKFDVRSRSSLEYINKHKGNFVFTGGRAVGYRNFFGIPWTSFMAEDSLFFINGILHLRVELSVLEQS
ncbi:hypothetical protein KIW84_030201 [Lathyrus oleraceus]|uniref:BTB domain-containing protein n=2 Tax=Pisum sativum TaxID=3888 RepID=A0A9D4XPR6_PEA|nr:hypothetical protein KIW84_030201 [Pisum sativum]